MQPLLDAVIADESNHVGSRPLVSIVIPTYNRAVLLPKALDACVSQTYQNLEVIVVNDGSRDNTEGVLRDYAARDARIRFITKANEGIPDTVNRGFREARGQYVTWTSDDNYYYPEAINEMICFLEKHADVSMVYADSRYIDGNGNDLGVVEAREPDSLEYHCAPAGCLLFRREVLDKVGPFRRQWVRCHDFDFYHRIYKAFRVARLPKVLYTYQWHDDSMSGNHVEHVLEHSRLMASYAENGRQRRDAWAAGYRELARSMHRDGRHWRSVYYQLRAALCQPERAAGLWRSLWTTSYASMPLWVKNGWRRAKPLFRLACRRS